MCAETGRVSALANLLCTLLQDLCSPFRACLFAVPSFSAALPIDPIDPTRSDLIKIVCAARGNTTLHVHVLRICMVIMRTPPWRPPHFPPSPAARRPCDHSLLTCRSSTYQAYVPKDRLRLARPGAISSISLLYVERTPRAKQSHTDTPRKSNCPLSPPYFRHPFGNERKPFRPPFCRDCRFARFKPRILEGGEQVSPPTTLQEQPVWMFSDQTHIPYVYRALRTRLMGPFSQIKTDR